MVTLKDIANRCGLSVATVSKAINNMPDISLSTAQRIQQVAREMGYMPNAAARSMKTGRSMTIGMLICLGRETIWTHTYSAQVANGVHHTMEDNGYDLTPVSHKGASSMGGYLNYCRYRNYDGLIVMSGGDPNPSLQELAGSDFPMVSIDCQLQGQSSVLSDNVEGMRRLVRYAYDRGHRKIAFIHGNDSSVTSDRMTGFFSICKELALEVPDCCIRQGDYLSREDSARATEELLALPNRPTCIFYPDDFACLGGIDVIKRRGLSIPGDISVVGYDGTRIAEAMQPPLTTYRQDCDAIGSCAAEMLLRIIVKPRSSISRHVIIPGRLMEGASVRDLNAL